MAVLDRRTFTAAGVLSGLSLLRGGARANSASSAPAREVTDKFRIGMLMFPGMTYLDFAGPNDIFARPRGAQVYALAKDLQPIKTDTGIQVMPDTKISEAPDFDLIFVGGGPGVAKLMEDDETLAFFQERAPRAKWLTAVCTGTLVLGAAGLLRGRKAATHWTAMDILPILGCEPVHERVVIDKNLITGGGVTAGIDFGLVVAERVWGTETAQLLQLGSEYDPQPPFNAGSPSKAPSAIVDRYETLLSKVTEARRTAATRAAANFR